MGGQVVKCQCGDITGKPCKGWDEPKRMISIYYQPKWATLENTWAVAQVLPECFANTNSNLHSPTDDNNE